MKRTFHTTVVGNFGQGNYGDDLLMRAILNALLGKVPAKDICVVAKEAAYLKNWYPAVNFVSPLNNKRYRTKYFIYGGGTQFFSFPSARSRWKNRVANSRNYLLNPKTILPRIWRIIYGGNQFQFEHLAAISIGIGPFVGDPSQENHYLKILKQCEFLSVRDSFCMSWLKHRDVTHALMYPDLCFNRELWADAPLNNVVKAVQKAGVGIIVRDWVHSKEGLAYLPSLWKSVESMREEGLSVKFISFAYDYDRNMRRLLAEKGEPLIAWNPLRYSPSEFAGELSSFEILITSRAHGVVVGCSMGVPTIAIEIEPKLQLIREQILDGCLGWSEPFDPLQLRQMVSKMMKDRAYFSETALAQSEQCGKKARKSIEMLFDWMELD